jgi:phage recombination protein Bet
MSKALAVATDQGFSKDDIDLIKSTVAKGATDNELKLFLYRCKNMGLDPLKPGQVHFVKYGSAPGSIIVGIEGFRSKAAATNKLSGIKRGVIRDEKGKVVAGWCEVYRTDWQHPAREEVAFSEYTTGKNLWQTKPETMIKKVAEVAALRMAFPDVLGGVYSDDEMPTDSHNHDRAKQLTATAKNVSERPDFEASTYFLEGAPDLEVEAKEDDPGEFVITVGKKFKGKKIKDVSQKDLQFIVDSVNEQANPHVDAKECAEKVQQYLEAHGGVA